MASAYRRAGCQSLCRGPPLCGLVPQPSRKNSLHQLKRCFSSRRNFGRAWPRARQTYLQRGGFWESLFVNRHTGLSSSAVFHQWKLCVFASFHPCLESYAARSGNFWLTAFDTFMTFLWHFWFCVFSFFFFFVPPSLSCSVIPIMMCARLVVWEVCGLSLGSGGQIASYFSRHISSASATLGVPGVLWPDASLRLGSRLLLVLTGFSSSLHQESQWRDNPLFVFSHCIQTNIENRYFLLFLLFKRFLWRYWLICAYTVRSNMCLNSSFLKVEAIVFTRVKRRNSLHLAAILNIFYMWKCCHDWLWSWN